LTKYQYNLFIIYHYHFIITDLLFQLHCMHSADTAAVRDFDS